MNAVPEIPDVAEVRARLDQLTAHLTAAQTLVAGGSSIDLTGLDAVVEALCLDVRGLPQANRQACKEPLIVLIDEFDRLTKLLAAQREVLQGQLKGLSDRQRAASAYGAAGGPHTDKGR